MRLIGRAAWWGRGCTGCMQCARPGKAAHLCEKRRTKRREQRAWRRDEPCRTCENAPCNCQWG